MLTIDSPGHSTQRCTEAKTNKIDVIDSMELLMEI